MGMSAVEAAKRRRAAPPPVPQQNQGAKLISTLQNMQNAPPAAVPRPMNLQQVIHLIDSRLLKIEKTIQETPPPVQVANSSMTTEEISEIVSNVIDEHISEFNTRSEMLANEIMQLKDIVLNLQNYTMSVNKMLLEERIQILSDIPQVTLSPDQEEVQLSGVSEVLATVSEATVSVSEATVIEATVSEATVSVSKATVSVSKATVSVNEPNVSFVLEKPETSDIFVSESPIVQLEEPSHEDIPLQVTSEPPAEEVSTQVTSEPSVENILEQVTSEPNKEEDVNHAKQSKSQRKRRSTFVLEQGEP
jgi:hypothetical protein